MKPDFAHRLVAAYQAGRLVPFLGAGMSYPACPLWEDFVDRLEQLAGLHRGSGDLLQRSHAAVRRLRREAPDRFPEHVLEALRCGSAEVPRKVALLGALYWPLVLTTNYDNLFWCASRYELAVLGRNPLDCHRVLLSLREPTAPILWALHGFVCGPCPAPTGRHAPEGPPATELVVGHEQYRRVIHGEAHFRRAFAEVYRSRSLLFLGTALADPHLLGLFEEILALGGPNPVPHFAVLFPEDKADRRYLAERLNTLPVEVESPEQLDELLALVRERIERPSGSAARWGWSVRDGAGGETDLEIVRGAVPRPGAGECIAVPADRDGQGRLVPAPEAARQLAGDHGREGIRVPVPPDSPYVARRRDSPWLLVSARAPEGNRRDLRTVATATTHLLARAQHEGFHTVRSPVLGVRGEKPFPPRFPLVQMVRAYAAAHRREAATPRLVLHVQDAQVLLELTSGRLDVTELLACEDIRFWCEVLAGEELERQLLFLPGDSTVQEAAAEFELSGSHWSVSVEPRPAPGEGPWPWDEVRGESLDALGVLPGCVLRFASTRVPPRR